MNVLFFLYCIVPIVFLLSERRFLSGFSLRVTFAFYIAFCLLFSLAALLTFHPVGRCNFLNAVPFVAAHNLVTEPGYLVGPVLVQMIFPSLCYIYPFVLCAPVAVIAKSRFGLRMVAQASFLSAHFGVTTLYYYAASHAD